jgi:hypothetical protein
MKLIRIQSDELEAIISDRLINHLEDDDADKVIAEIMGDVSKSNPFKVWSR